MIEKLFKNLFIKIAAGTIVLFVILFGLFLLGRKPPQSSIPNTETWVARKIPKSNLMVEPSVKKISAKLPSPENVPETTMEEKIPEPDETLLNPENSFEPEEGDKAELISAIETPEGGEMAEPVSVHETDELPGMEAGGKIVGEEPAEETGLRISEEPETEKPAVTEQPKLKTLAAEKKPLLSEPDKKQSIQDIVLSESDSEYKLIVRTNSSVTNYKYFFLSNPPRFVVDFPGDWKNPDFIERKPDSSLISRIRLWNHGDKLRIVNDLKSDKTLVPIVTKSSDGIEVVLKAR